MQSMRCSLNIPLPSPPLPPPVASSSPSRRLIFPLTSPQLPPPVASTSPSRRLHFPLPSPPLPPPVASTSPSRRLHFPCEGCSKLSLLPSPLSILPPPLSPSRPSSPPRRVAIWRHLRVFYAHVAMSEAPSPSTPHSCFLTRAPPHSLHAALFFPPNFFQSFSQKIISVIASTDKNKPPSPSEEELYGEKILSVDSLTSDFYSMLSSHLSILPSLRSLTLSPSTSSPFSVCCALTSSATPGSMRCGWWEA
ncbi:unnamed protein product [Closterium sp. Naga37s-1]|nr:unnamed protein product [Closterium sp. Naga37s-1]